MTHQELVAAVAQRVTDEAVYEMALATDCSTMSARSVLEAEAVADLTGRPIDYHADWRDVERSERSEMADLFSDLYKDRYGFRPRAELARANAEGWTVQDFRDEIAKLPPLTEDDLCAEGVHPNAKWVDMGDEMVLVCPDCGNHVG